MILDFNSFRLNESSLKKLKKEIHGSLNRLERKRMRYELRHNIITFKFRKRNGDLRKAVGTLHSDYIPKSRGGGPRPEHQMVYYDLDKEGWRSFRSYSFIKITDIKPIDTSKKKVVSKSASSEDEEEKIKKIRPIEKEEKIEKEEVHKEESDKLSHKPEHSGHKTELHKEESEPEKTPEKEEKIESKRKKFSRDDDEHESDGDKKEKDED